MTHVVVVHEFFGDVGHTVHYLLVLLYCDGRQLPERVMRQNVVEFRKVRETNQRAHPQRDTVVVVVCCGKLCNQSCYRLYPFSKLGADL